MKMKAYLMTDVYKRQMICDAVNFLVILQFVNCIALLKHYFSIINHKILTISLLISTQTGTDKRTGYLGTKEFSCINKDVLSDQRCIHMIREYHRYLCNLCKHVNSLFSVHLILTLVYIIVSITVLFYTLALNLLKGVDFTFQNSQLGTIIVLADNISRLIIIVSMTTNTSSEVCIVMSL